MDMCIRKSFVIVTFVALAIAAASGQMNPQSAARPCVAKDEVVHKAGESGVKPPKRRNTLLTIGSSNPRLWTARE
jgi:hypothetical protein